MAELHHRRVELILPGRCRTGRAKTMVFGLIFGGTGGELPFRIGIMRIVMILFGGLLCVNTLHAASDTPNTSNIREDLAQKAPALASPATTDATPSVTEAADALPRSSVGPTSSPAVPAAQNDAPGADQPMSATALAPTARQQPHSPPFLQIMLPKFDRSEMAKRDTDIQTALDATHMQERKLLDIESQLAELSRPFYERFDVLEWTVLAFASCGFVLTFAFVTHFLRKKAVLTRLPGRAAAWLPARWRQQFLPAQPTVRRSPPPRNIPVLDRPINCVIPIEAGQRKAAG